jgi:hypothetical protein
MTYCITLLAGVATIKAIKHYEVLGGKVMGTVIGCGVASGCATEVID